MFLPYKEEVTGSNPVAPTRVFQKSLHICALNPQFVEKHILSIMKYKKDLNGLFVFLAIVWSVFHSISENYTPT